MKTGAKLFFVVAGMVGVMSLAVGLFSAPVSALSGVVINEFSANASDGDTDWVELYNPGAEAVGLNGWYLRDTAVSNLKTFSSEDAIPAGGYFVAQVGSRLGNAGDAITLYNDSGVVDAVMYPDQVGLPGVGQSTGRIYDGAGEWKVFDTPSKGAPNQTTVPIYGEIRVHAVTVINDNGFPDFSTGEPHQAGVPVRIYDEDWNLVEQGITTGKTYSKSLRFTLVTGNYVICQPSSAGYQQSFAKTITGWYSMADTSTANLSGQIDEYESCVSVAVDEGVVTSHVFGLRQIAVD